MHLFSSWKRFVRGTHPKNPVLKKHGVFIVWRSKDRTYDRWLNRPLLYR